MDNFITRTLTGILFVAILVGGILYHPLTFGILFAAITALGVWEFCTLINGREDAHVNRLICTVAGVYLFFALFGFTMQAWGSEIFIPYLVALIYLLVSELYLQHPNPINNWACAMLSQLYIALPFALLNTLAFQNSVDPMNPDSSSLAFEPLYPLSLFIFLWASDSGAYCCGMLLGKHRLFPRISPKKSWEGSIGGGILAILVSLIIAHITGFPPLKWMGFALVVVIFGTWGDLVESLLKRQLGIKDSGKILPGHGGILDRFDSALLAIPASIVYLYTLTQF